MIAYLKQTNKTFLFYQLTQISVSFVDLRLNLYYNNKLLLCFLTLYQFLSSQNTSAICIKMQTSIKQTIWLIIIFIQFYQIKSLASSSRVNTRDVYMASYPVGLRSAGTSGPYNFTTTFPYTPDISPSSPNYKIIASTSLESDYTITSKTISIQFQIIGKNQTNVKVSLYSDYYQNFNNKYFYASFLFIDVLSPTYPFILPSVLRFNNVTLMSTTISTNVSVSSFNSTNLIMGNDLVIYSFLMGFIIQSQNSSFQLTTTSQILDAATIRVNLSSIVNLINVTCVRIDTVVMDKTQLTFSKMYTLDFQTANCPSCSYIFTFPSYTDNFQNIFTGLSSFNTNKGHFYFNLTINPSNITIGLLSSYNFTYIVFHNLYFAKWKCQTGFPYFDAPTNLCYDTSCPVGNYRVVVPISCLPCLYDCTTCQNNSACLTCDQTTNFRVFDNSTSRCSPLPGYYDDGTDNIIAKPCSSPCLNCLGSALYCLDCVNNTFYPESGICKLCSQNIKGCVTCNDSLTCTSCNSSNNWQLDLNSSLCVSIDGYYEDGNNSVAQPCELICGTCMQTASNCTSCVNTTYYLQVNQCLQCSIAIINCQSCTSSTNCTQCQTTYFVDGGLCATCQYSCLTCDNPINCTSCNSSDFRQLNPNTSQCDPMNGYFDDGTNNSMTQPCEPICITCSGSATYCTSCPNDTYYLLNGHCNLCNSTLTGCIACNDVTTCTSCETAYFLMNQTCGSCLYSCETCNTTDTCTTCNSSTNRQLNLNTSQCDPINGYYDDGMNNSMALPCSDPCLTCQIGPNICITCVNDTYAVNPLNSQCNLCSSLLVNCETCFSANTCTLCSVGPFYLSPATSDCSSTNCTVCANCLYDCYTCDNGNNCSSCNTTTDFRQLSSNTSRCVPISGYFDDGHSTIAQPCSFPCLDCSTTAVLCTSCINDTYGINLVNSHCQLCRDLISGCDQCMNSSACLVCQVGYFMTFTFKCTSTCGDSFLNTLKQECDDGNNYNSDGCDTYCNIQNEFNCTLSGQTSVCIYLGQVQLSIDTVIKTPNKNQVQLLISYGPSNLRAWQDVNFSQILGTTVPYSSIKVVPGNNGQLTLVLDYTQDISNTNQNFTLDPSLSGLTVFSLTPQSNTSNRMVSANNQPTYFYPESVYDLQALLNNVGLGVSILALLGFALSIFGPKIIGTEMIMVFQFTFLSLMDISDLNPLFNALKNLKITMGYSLFSDDQTVYDSNSPYEVRGAPMYSQFVKNYNLIIVLILLPFLIGLIVKLLVRFSLIDKSNILARNKKYLIGEYTFMGAAFGANCIFVSLFLQVFYGKKDMTTMIGLISLGVCALMPIFVIAYGILLYKKPKMFRNYTTESFKINFQSGFCLGTVCLSLIISLIMTLGVDLKFAIPICIGVYTGIFIFIIIKKPYLGRGNIRSCANIVILIAVMGMMTMYRVLDNNFRQNGMGIYFPIAVLTCLIICLCYNIPILIYNVVINLKNCGKFDQLDDDLIKENMSILKKVKDVKSPMLSIADKFSNIRLTDTETENSSKMERYQELLKSIPKLNPKLNNKEEKIEYNENQFNLISQPKQLINESFLDKQSKNDFSQLQYDQSQVQNLRNLQNDDNDEVEYANSPQTRRSPRKLSKNILNNPQDNMSDLNLQERSIIKQESMEEDAI